MVSYFLCNVCLVSRCLLLVVKHSYMVILECFIAGQFVCLLFIEKNIFDVLVNRRLDNFFPFHHKIRTRKPSISSTALSHCTSADHSVPLAIFITMTSRLSEITPCNKIDKPLVVYRLLRNAMPSIITLHKRWQNHVVSKM